MRRRWILLLSLVFGTYSLIGCTKPALREKKIGDPLLTSKKPIEGVPAGNVPRALVQEEFPQPPQLGEGGAALPAKEVSPVLVPVRGNR